jgi:hypothetical protein
MPSEEALALGRSTMAGLLGADALYRAESGDGEGLAVLNMDTERVHRPESFGGYADARVFFQELRGQAASVPEADRRHYYDQLCHSTLAFLTWRAEGLGFADQLRHFLHVPVAPASDQELHDLRGDLKRLLDGMGYGGDLATQCAAWEARNRVPADEVPGVLTDLLAEAWTRTEERVVEIPAPRSDGMRVSPVRGVAYNARCDYLSRTIELNVDPVLTRPALKHLAVHEGYPGHYVQFKLRETLAREGRAPADVLLSVVNTASSSVFEGIADAGMEAMGWVESDDDRFQAVMNRYRAGIGTGAAWRLHALGRPAGEVTDWLRARSLVGGDGWVENRMRFIAAPSRAVLIWSYWWGEASVAPAWARVPRGRRGDFVHFLYGRMHSNDTVGMFS